MATIIYKYNFLKYFVKINFHYFYIILSLCHFSCKLIDQRMRSIKILIKRINDDDQNNYYSKLWNIFLFLIEAFSGMHFLLDSTLKRFDSLLLLRLFGPITLTQNTNKRYLSFLISSADRSLLSISSTFFVRVFCTNVVLAAFF